MIHPQPPAATTTTIAAAASSSPMLPSSQTGAQSAVRRPRLLEELERLLQENHNSKVLNQQLQENINALKVENQSLLKLNDKHSKQQDDEDKNDKDKLKIQLRKAQVQNQANQEFISSLKQQNKQLNDKIVQLTVQTVISDNEVTLLTSKVQHLDNSQTANNNETASTISKSSDTSNERNVSSEKEEILINELQDTIEILQKRVMYLIEEKLELQTQVEYLEHHLVEEKAAMRKTMDNNVSQKKFFAKKGNTLEALPIIVTKETNQADIIRQTLERKRKKKVFSKPHIHKEKTIDIEMYKKLSHQYMVKQKQLQAKQLQAKRLQAKKQQAKEKETESVGSTPDSPASSTLYVHNRLWDFQDWEIDNEGEVASEDSEQNYHYHSH
jgi:hypothetical protein